MLTAKGKVIGSNMAAWVVFHARSRVGTIHEQAETRRGATAKGSPGERRTKQTCRKKKDLEKRTQLPLRS